MPQSKISGELPVSGFCFAMKISTQDPEVTRFKITEAKASDNWSFQGLHVGCRIH